MPVTGSWIWWLGSPYLADPVPVLLCEDLGSHIFAEAKSHLQGVDTVKDLAEANASDAAGRDSMHHMQRALRGVFPDIFSWGLWSCLNAQVIAVGRTVLHRERAACVGLAAQLYWFLIFLFIVFNF